MKVFNETTNNDSKNDSALVSNAESSQRHLLEDSNFLKLKQSQQRIFEATDISPSIRKLINKLINDKSIKELEQEFINQLNLN